jgi:hypothetical protein
MFHALMEYHFKNIWLVWEKSDLLISLGNFGRCVIMVPSTNDYLVPSVKTRYGRNPKLRNQSRDKRR